MEAGDMFCKACRGNRLVPARWWPAAAASMALLACAISAMGVLIVAIYLTEDTPASSAPATATPVPAKTAEQTTLPISPVSATPLPDQSFSAIEPPTAPPVSTRAATFEPTRTSTPTNTPVPAPTNTPVPMPTNTPVPMPTDTPAPTSTPTPVPTTVPVPDPRFRADQTTIGAGGCTVLRWDVDGVKGVYLDGQGRPGHSTEVVCPELSHTYTLKVVMPDGREASHSLHVQVMGYRPLKLSVLVTYRGCDTVEKYRAEISIWAKGGDKQYTYYVGDLNHYIGGPTEKGMVYRVSWRKCGGMPGMFIVRSGDGQEDREPFWVEPPDCCEEW